MNRKYENTDFEPNIVADAAIAYHAKKSPLRLVHQSRAGIKRADLLKFAKGIDRTLLELSEILPSSYSTLTKKDIFDKTTSEHIIRLKTLYEQGIEVFGDLASFNTWLDQSIEAYEDASSFSLLDTSFGMKLVSDAIHKIDYGLPV